MLIRQSEAAKILGVHRITLNRWARRGLLKPIQTPRPGRWYRQDEVDLFRLCDCYLTQDGRSHQEPTHD